MKDESRLRIVVITTVPQTLAAFFPRQLRSLAEAGFDVHAVSSPGPDLDAIGLIPGVTIHGLAMERQPRPLQDCRSLLNLYRLIKQLRPQIVHSHTPKAGLLGMAAARAAGVPVRLYSIHGLPLETRAGNFRKVLEAAERGSAALSTRTYAISWSVNQRVRELNLCPAAKLATLGDGSCAGVDLDRFDADADWTARRAALRRKVGLPEQALLLTYVGRLSVDKGTGVLAEAWPMIAQQVPELHLLLAGEPDPTDPLPASALQSLRNDPRVHFAGGVSQPDVPVVYASSDLFVLPTFREGLSQVALEAGAMGVPIVSTRVTGLDAVQDGRTGLLVPARQSAPLAAAIVELARSAEQRGQLSSAAKEHVRAKYSAERVNHLWMAEYKRLVSESLPGFGPATGQIENRV